MSMSLEKIRLGFIKLNETLKFQVESAVDDTPETGKTYRYKSTGQLVRCIGNGGRGCAWVRPIGSGKNKQEPFEAFSDELEEVPLHEAIDESVRNILVEGMHGDDWANTSWTDTIDGKDVTVTIKDMLDLIKEKPVREIATKILEPYALHKKKTDAETLANVQKSNLDYPIIVLKKHSDYQILDGHHRLQKAINNNIPSIKARVIELKDMPGEWQKVFESAGKDAATAEAEIKEGVEGEHIDDRVFSGDYTGPRWTYGLRNRPMGMGAQPKGFIIGSGGPAAGRARHGTIQYPRELTKDELYDFELELISGSEVNEAKQRLDSKCWKGYRKKGTKIKSNKRVNNCVKENLAGSKSDSKQHAVSTKSTATSNSKLIENWIEEYKKSNQSRFSGKSESARVKMAISDFNKVNLRKKEKASLTECMDGGKDTDSMEITRLELDEVADMADDLFAALPNYPEFPAWVGHKIAALHAGLQSVYDYYLLQTSKGSAESSKVICVNPNSTNVPLPPVLPAGI